MPADQRALREMLAAMARLPAEGGTAGGRRGIRADSVLSVSAPGGTLPTTLNLQAGAGCGEARPAARPAGGQRAPPWRRARAP